LAEVSPSFISYLPWMIGVGFLLYLGLFMAVGAPTANRMVTRIGRFVGGGLVRLMVYLGRVILLTVFHTGVLLVRLILGRGRPAIATHAWGRYWEALGEVFVGRR
jgi:hypothetical protein